MMGAGNAPEPDAEAVLRDLRAQEARLHYPERRMSRADIEAMIAPDFLEVGASGCRYRRDVVLDVLRQRHGQHTPDDWHVHDFACIELGASTWLLTYTLEQGPRITRRSTIWRRMAHVWVALYHQGTLVRED